MKVSENVRRVWPVMLTPFRNDNTNHVEASFSGHCWQFHSHMLEPIP